MKNTAGFDEENIKYLEEMFGEKAIRTFLRVNNGGRVFLKKKKITCENIKRCLEEMQKFGDNRWWLSDDKRLIAYYQFHANVLLVPMGTFMDAVPVLLGHTVLSHEVWYDWEERKKEVERAFSGVPYTEEEQEKATAKSVEKLFALVNESN